MTDEAERVRALRMINDRLVETWDSGRLPNDSEMRRTLVLAIPLAEASAKVRSGDPGDEPDDLTLPHWAGSVPLVCTWGALEPSADLVPGIDPPRPVSALAGTETG